MRGKGSYHQFISIYCEDAATLKEFDFYLNLVDVIINGETAKYSVVHIGTWCELPEELASYFSDTLAWIPSFSTNGKSMHGLNYDGPTLIKKNGIGVLHNIVVGWRSILQESPDPIVLTERLAYVSETERKVLKYSLPKESVMENLRLLCNITVPSSDKNHYIVHLGI